MDFEKQIDMLFSDTFTNLY